MSITGSKSLNSNNIEGVSTAGILDQLQNQVPINTINITNLQQATTGITYNATGDLTTIDNNLTISSTKILKSAYAAQANEDVANKLYVDNKVAAIVDSAPATLDTLNELAAALGDDANFSTTITTLIGTKASLTGNQTMSGTNNFSNISNTYYGSGANLSNINSSTLTTTTMLSTGTYYLPFTTSSTGASSLTPYTIDQISYDRNNNRLTVPNLNSFGQLKMTSTDNTMRQIWNTFYNFMDTSTTAGGVKVGRLYADSLNNYYIMDNSLATMSFVFGAPGSATFPLQITSTQATFTNPPICSINCSTDTQLANKAYVDIASSKITTSQLPSTGTYYLPFLTSSVAGSGLTAYSDGNIYYDRTNNRLHVPNLYSYGLADFLNSPTCSVPPTTGNHLVNKTYCDNASSNSPVGTIIMYGSNTIPVGWLLCNGSNVSKTTYADLWNVIGDSFMFVPPPTGFFTLPNLVGQYPRGAGTNSTLSVTKTTTLGQTIAGQVGKHAHTSANMSTPTQGTTGTTSVLTNVTGVVGLLKTNASVCSPLVTTSATTGTSQTSIDAYKPYPTILTDETYPNSVSVNYIIKFQTSATPTPLSTPTFTQTSSVLTIQNNSPISGIINFTLNNASSIFQTPLSLSSTAISVSMPITCSSAPTIGGHLVNKTYVDALVSGGVVTTNTDQTITGIKTFSNNLITSSGVFGRNDGFAYNVASTTGTTSGLYPIGHCWEILGALTTFGSGSTYPGVPASIALTKGVWAISGYIVLQKGTGVYLVGSSITVLWDTVTGIKIYPASSGLRFPIPSTNTSSSLYLPVGTINVVVTAPATQTVNVCIIMTPGTAKYQVSFTGVKIA